LAVFALLKFLVAGIIDLLFLLRSSENLSDSVLLLASAMALEFLRFRSSSIPP